VTLSDPTYPKPYHFQHECEVATFFIAADQATIVHLEIDLSTHLCCSHTNAHTPKVTASAVCLRQAQQNTAAEIKIFGFSTADMFLWRALTHPMGNRHSFVEWDGKALSPSERLQPVINNSPCLSAMSVSIPCHDVTGSASVDLR